MAVQQFLKEQTEVLRKHYVETTTKTWLAQTTGEKEWSEKLAEAQAAFNKYLSNKELYEKTEDYLFSPNLSQIDRRQLLTLSNLMKENQLSTDILDNLSNLSSELNYMFNTYSPEIDGKKLSANYIREVLVNSTDSEKREKAWKASKEVGQVVEGKLIELIKKRNEAARQLGYENHHEMAFELQELDREEIFSMFAKLLELSEATFRKMKIQLDQRIATRFGIEVREIRPWHYSDPFFQSAPASQETDLDNYFKDKDINALTAATFDSMGIDIKDLFEKSDLFPREGKNPTAFCIDIDREGDTRVLCNLTPTAYWMGTNLHEFGHAAYNKYINRELPFILRDCAHTLTTEAIAMLYGKMIYEVEWLEKFLHLDKETVVKLEPHLKSYQQFNMLASARFIITFVYFERELYENPDQDLNSLWWSLVEKIQLVTPPENRNEPDWAAKIHFTLAPVYYQNYLLGELTSAQLHETIKNTISEEFFTKKVGNFIRDEFLKPGSLYNWNEKIEKVTGQPLNPSFFVDAFCKEEVNTK
ncbi:M2 family metallopeptidase [Bacillus timonensis]|nr:M2 family metallopeptidase [Bacillus timonensis]